MNADTGYGLSCVRVPDELFPAMVCVADTRWICKKYRPSRFIGTLRSEYADTLTLSGEVLEDADRSFFVVVMAWCHTRYQVL